MHSSTRNTIIIVIGVLLLLGLLGYTAPKIGTAFDKGVARSTAQDFGKQLQKVSLLERDASSTIASFYGPYVTPELLAIWQQKPSKAPGRPTSSPWPDHIDIVKITPQGESYIVEGDIILMTSTGEVGKIPVVMQLVRGESGKWLIAAYQEQGTR